MGQREGKRKRERRREGKRLREIERDKQRATESSRVTNRMIHIILHGERHRIWY